MFTLRNVGVSYGRFRALRSVYADFSLAEFTAIVGPNGAGKSTLLNVMAGLKGGYTGECMYDEREVRAWNRAHLARRVSFVPQEVRIDFPFSAEQVVLMGRTPFADTMFETAEDTLHVERAMELTETLQFRHRDFRTLSGGEKKRVVLASALAQTPEALLLDEPTTFLDLEHQISLYRLLRSLTEQGTMVVSITHDLNLASTYADRILLLQDGELQADGHPSHVLEGELLQKVFRVESVISKGPSGRPWIHYGE